MAWPAPLFGTLTALGAPLANLDLMFQQIAAMVAIPCTATGTNALTLVPAAGNNPPLPVPAVQGAQVTWVQPASSTAGVSINGISLVAYDNTQITNQLVINQRYTAVFGGTFWQLLNYFTTGITTTALGSGASGPAIWAATQAQGSGGAITLLNTLNASNSASISDTTNITSAYSTYLFTIYNNVCASGSTGFTAQFHSGGSFQATNYFSGFCGYGSTNSTSQSLTTSTTTIQLENTGATFGRSNGVVGTSAGWMLAFNLPATAGVKGFLGMSSNGSINEYSGFFAGIWNSQNAVDGIQFLQDSGNLTTCTVKIYGLS